MTITHYHISQPIVMVLPMATILWMDFNHDTMTPWHHGKPLRELWVNSWGAPFRRGSRIWIEMDAKWARGGCESGGACSAVPATRNTLRQRKEQVPSGKLSHHETSLFCNGKTMQNSLFWWPFSIYDSYFELTRGKPRWFASAQITRESLSHPGVAVWGLL